MSELAISLSLDYELFLQPTFTSIVKHSSVDRMDTAPSRRWFQILQFLNTPRLILSCNGNEIVLYCND